MACLVGWPSDGSGVMRLLAATLVHVQFRLDMGVPCFSRPSEYQTYLFLPPVCGSSLPLSWGSGSVGPDSLATPFGAYRSTDTRNSKWPGRSSCFDFSGTHTVSTGRSIPLLGPSSSRKSEPKAAGTKGINSPSWLLWGHHNYFHPLFPRPFFPDIYLLMTQNHIMLIGLGYMPHPEG